MMVRVAADFIGSTGTGVNLFGTSGILRSGATVAGFGLVNGTATGTVAVFIGVNAETARAREFARDFDSFAATVTEEISAVTFSSATGPFVVEDVKFPSRTVGFADSAIRIFFAN